MADTGNQDELISQFIGVTGTDGERAKFFLESADWQLQVALASFFDADDNQIDSDPPIPEAAFPETVNTADVIPVSASASSGSQSQKTQKSKPPRASSRFATVSDLKQQEEDEDSGEEGERFYTGGADHGSGQQVVGPRRKKAANIVNDIFKSAKEHGAEELSPSSPPLVSNRSGNFVFRGAAYRLGETSSEPARAVPGTAGTLPGTPPKEKHVKLKLWKNGFSVDNGDLRDYKDPQNQTFLASVSKGEIPMELIRQAKGGEVNLDLEDHREEPYTQPKHKMAPFAGQGHMLGSPVPNISETASSQHPPSTNIGGTRQGSLNVDSSQPITSLQLRLADGTRLTGEFNHSHTVGDIRQYIQEVRCQYAGASFKLMTTFPNKVLADDSQSLADAKLLNAVIVQRLT